MLKFGIGIGVGLGALIAVSAIAFGGGGSSASGPSGDSVALPATAAVGAMSVFSQPPRAVDQMPDSLTPFLADFDSQDANVADGLKPGALDITESRRLFADVGSDHASLYAVPTDKGRVCFIVSSGPYGGCIESFGGGNPPVTFLITDPDKEYVGQPTEVFGLTPDSATSIDVLEGGTSHPAQLQNNAFFYQLASAADYPQAIVVNYADGSSARENVEAPPQRD